MTPKKQRWRPPQREILYTKHDDGSVWISFDVEALRAAHAGNRVHARIAYRGGRSQHWVPSFHTASTVLQMPLGPDLIPYLLGEVD